MSPFKELYWWRCNTPIIWSDPLNRVFIGLYILVDMEKEMHVIKKNHKEINERNKSYVDQDRVFKEL